jgi:hypothetical protein
VRLATPSLPRTWLTCLFGRVEGDHEFLRDALVRRAHGQHSQHFPFAAGQRLDQARHRRGGASPGARSRAFPVECLYQPGQAPERDALGSGRFCLGGEQPTKQGTAARVGRWPELE